MFAMSTSKQSWSEQISERCWQKHQGILTSMPRPIFKTFIPLGSKNVRELYLKDVMDVYYGWTNLKLYSVWKCFWMCPDPTVKIYICIFLKVKSSLKAIVCLQLHCCSTMREDCCLSSNTWTLSESPRTEKVKVNTVDWSEKSVPNDAVMTGHTFCAVSAFVLLYRLFCCSSMCASAVV